MNSSANVYHHPGRLIDDSQVGIFIDEVQGNGFREESARFGLRQRDLDLFLAAQLVACLRRLAIQEDLMFFNPFLDLRAALFWKCFAQEAVETLALVCCFGGQCGHDSHSARRSRMGAICIKAGAQHHLRA